MRSRILHYLAYLRPLSFAPTFLLALTGYAVSPARPSEAIAIALDLGLLFLVHSVFLWGGANAFNSSQDRDTEPVNLLPSPPPMPKHLAAFGLLANGAAIALAATRGALAVLVVTAGVVASTFYSWKHGHFRRGKEIGVVDNLINAAGSGAGAILLGYAFTPAPLDRHVVVVALAFTVATFGGVPTSQIFQLRPEDRYQDARNYASLLGAKTTLRVGALLFIVHVVLVLALGRPAGGVGLALWLGWALFALAGSAHSLRWSRAPFQRPYHQMTRQLALMMASQTLWTGYAWHLTS
jgi:4-hydroxybenzoate polyprenyltransferase